MFPSNRVTRCFWRYEVRRFRTRTASDGLAQYESWQMLDSGRVATAFRAIVGDAPREHLLAFYLDAKNCLMGYETVAIGVSTEVLVEPAQVLRGALLAGAIRIIVAHNHPSGDSTPSDEDVRLTEHLAAAAHLIGIPLLDHVVVSAEGLYSFVGAGQLRSP